MSLKFLSGQGIDGNITVNGSIVGNTNNTTEVGTYSTGAIKRIRMVQGGELHFGDTTTAAPLGITEGDWNQFADQDRLSIYGRNSIKFYSGGISSVLQLTLDTNATFAGNIAVGGAALGTDTLTPLGSITLPGNAKLFGYANSIYSISNAYYDGGWKYLTTNTAAVLNIGTNGASALTLRQAASGTANDAITFTTSFEINSSGNAIFAGALAGTSAAFTGLVTTKIYKITSASISNSYVRVAEIDETGNQLSSCVRVTMTAHGGSHVNTCNATIAVGHSQDILIQSSGLAYTQVTLKVDSNNNGRWTLSVKSSSANAANYQFDIEGLSNNLTIELLPTSSQTGTTLEHTTNFGTNVTGVSSNTPSSAGLQSRFGGNVFFDNVDTNNSNTSALFINTSSLEIEKRTLGTGAFGPTPVGSYLPLAGGTMANTNLVTNMNADLLDGFNASQFLRSDAADTSTGEILFDAGFKSDSILLSGAQNFDNISRSGFDYGTMVVVGGNKQNSSFGFQMANERLGNGLYIRGMNDSASAWSSWAEVWTSTADGAGSGLDADLLDGQQGSYYNSSLT